MKLSFTLFPRYGDILLSPPLNPPLFSSFWTSFGLYRGLPFGSDGKESACNVGDPGSIPEFRSSGEGNGYPLQYSCLENSMDRGAWWATVNGVAKNLYNQIPKTTVICQGVQRMMQMTLSQSQEHLVSFKWNIIMARMPTSNLHNEVNVSLDSSPLPF